MFFTSLTVNESGLEAVAVMITLLCVISGIVIWATWPEEVERMKKLREERESKIKHL